MSDKDETGKSSVQDNEESHTEGSLVSVSSVVDQVRVRALAKYRSIVTDKSKMDGDQIPESSLGREDSQIPESSETQGIADRVADALRGGKHSVSGTRIIPSCTRQHISKHQIYCSSSTNSMDLYRLID